MSKKGPLPTVIRVTHGQVCAGAIYVGLKCVACAPVLRKRLRGKSLVMALRHLKDTAESYDIWIAEEDSHAPIPDRRSA